MNENLYILVQESTGPNELVQEVTADNQRSISSQVSVSFRYKIFAQT